MARGNRDFDVSVRDADGRPLLGPRITFKVNGEEVGEVPMAEGHGSIRDLHPDDTLEISASYRLHRTQIAKPGKEQASHTFTFNTVAAMSKGAEKMFAAIFGVAFLITILVIALIVPNPTPFQYQVFRIVLAVAVGGFTGTFSGFLEVQISGWLKAGGALAAFVIVFFYNPAALVAEPPPARPAAVSSILDSHPRSLPQQGAASDG